jgi:hypothetical protein
LGFQESKLISNRFLNFLQNRKKGATWRIIIVHAWMDIHITDVGKGKNYLLPDSISFDVEPELGGASDIPIHPWMLLPSCLSSTGGSTACALFVFTAMVLARDDSNTWK